MAVNDKRVDEHREAVEAVDADPVLELRVWGMRSTQSKTLWKGQGPIGITLGNNPVLKNVCNVIYTVPDDQAALAGLREGDIILSLNGFPAQDHQHGVEVRGGCLILGGPCRDACHAV